jgi:hypothetical protein
MMSDRDDFSLFVSQDTVVKIVTLDFRRPTTSRPISEVREHFPYSKNKFLKKSSDRIPRNGPKKRNGPPSETLIENMF